MNTIEKNKKNNKYIPFVQFSSQQQEFLLSSDIYSNGIALKLIKRIYVMIDEYHSIQFISNSGVTQGSNLGRVIFFNSYNNNGNNLF